MKENQSKYIFFVVLMFVLLLFQLLYYAHHTPSQLDEGSFLIKGYYFVSGIFQPFQEYGPWTNNMPLSYYIPGLAQFVFGPGLQTGRYFAVFLTLSGMLGSFLTIKQTCGKWWAAGVLAFAVLSPSVLNIYSVAISEGLVACGLAWLIYFLTKESEKPINIILTTLMSVLVVFIRQNMVLVVPFVVLWYFWLKGRKAGAIASSVGIAAIIIGHLIFYPEILRLWYPWVPEFLEPLFQAGWPPLSGTMVWNPEFNLTDQLGALLEGVRTHPLVFLGFLLAPLFFLRNANWVNKNELKKFFLLFALLFILIFMHAWASLGTGYCVSCFSTYVGFYFPLSLVMMMFFLCNMVRHPHQKIDWLIITIVIVFLLLFFYTNANQIKDVLLSIQIPRMKNLQFQEGSVPIWNILVNKFGAVGDLIHIVSLGAGFFSVVLLALITILAYRMVKLTRKPVIQKVGFTTIYIVFLLLGMVFLSTFWLIGGSLKQADCPGDVLQSYQRVGSQIAASIEPGKVVHWCGGKVVTPLLYIPQAKIFPPILNGIYSKRDGGDRDSLERAGYYNDESLSIWLGKSDYMLCDDRVLTEKYLNDFEKFIRTDPLNVCDPTSYFQIYKRKN
jgi:hypothetical protein